MNNNRRPISTSAHRVRRDRYTDNRPDPTAQDAEAARSRPAADGLVWKKMDLHLHTPASSDYRDPGISYLDILKKAEEKNLDMIAFADHNTVAGYAAMHQELETLSLLERLGRISKDEQATLDEYRRLLKKIVVLPAFEFTATFGFHILGIFPEGTSIRKLEYLLLNLNVPEEKMLRGAPDAGSTADVLTAYATITQAGGMAIAAHANSSNGVAMQGFPFGGQTKIAYTQDPNLVALEVTDLEQTGRRTTASFYNGTKPEYPRRMHCIQGSDAHSLETEQSDANNKRLGVGARITEVLVREASYAGLREVLTGDDFTRTRPYHANTAWERIDASRQRGPNQIVAFHDRAIHPSLRTRHIMQDVVAFANGYGGIIYVGASADPRLPLQGIERPDEMVRVLREDVHKMVEPQLDVNFDVKIGAGDRGVIVMNVPGGDNRPYIFSPTSQIYIRDGGNSLLATRDEMIKLIVEATRARGELFAQATPTAPARVVEDVEEATEPEEAPQAAQPAPQQERPREERRQSWRDRRDERRAAAAQAQPEPEAPADEPTPAPAPTPTLTPVREERPAPATLREERLAPTPVPERPAAQAGVPVRRPALHELPPEKIKGQVRPMARHGAAEEAPTQAPESFEDAAMAADDVSPEIEQAIIEESREGVAQSLPEIPEIVVEGAEQSTTGLDTVAPPRSGRQRRKPGDRLAAPEPEAAPAQEAPAESAAEPAPEPQPEKPARRSRRRGAAAAETAPAEEAPAEGPQPGQSGSPTLEVAAPMEATVAAEHLSREELVEAEAEKPKRGRSRRGRSAAQEQALEVDAPTAAAAATDAGTEGILVEAEVTPGPQIPAELPPDTPAEPARKGRSRRKSAAVQAAEADAGLADPQPAQPEESAEPAVREAHLLPEAAPEAPAEGTSKRRRGKRGAASAAETAVAELAPGDQLQAAAASDMPLNFPPPAPTTGVEIIDSQAGVKAVSHTMRDLRNGQTVRNVTKQSARRLWHYAITQHERGDPALSEVLWHDSEPIGLWRRDERAGAVRFDLVSRYPDGSLRVFYGVTEEGISGPWRELVEQAEAAGYTGPDVTE